MNKTLSKNKQALIEAYDKGYRVINQEVISSKGKVLKPRLTPEGYRVFNKSFEGETRRIWIHHLVAYQKYRDKLLEKGIVVRHKNGNQLDNSENNILIGTQSQNMYDRSKEDLLSHSLKASTHTRRFTDKEVTKIRKLRSEGMFFKDIGNMFGVGKSTIHYAVNTKYQTTKK